MDTSIRLYNTNSRLRSVLNAEHPVTELPDEASRVQVSGDEGTHVSEGISQQSVAALQEQARVDVADFEAIFQRFQGPITNFIYHLIGNREQAYDLAQDVFVKAYKALLGGTIVQPGALSAWLYRIAANTTTDTLRRRKLISWLPLSLFNEDRGIGAGVLSDSGGVANEGFSSGGEESGERHGGVASTLYERGGYDGGRFENRVADREIVERVMNQLQPKYAVCLWLYEHDGLSCAEIAQVLNISPSAVKMRLMRARERFIALHKQEVTEA
jgi:RNA polymerase sigma-70 factor, ECF subfamily